MKKKRLRKNINRRPPATALTRADMTKKSLKWRPWGRAIFGCLAASFGIWQAYVQLKPTIVIAVGESPSRNQQLASRFTISNDGWFSAYDLRFACSYGRNMRYFTFTGHISPDDLDPLAILSRDDPATRSCSTPAVMNEGGRISFEVSYDWPIIGYHDSVEAAFDIIKGEDGYFLVRNPVDDGTSFAAVKVIR
jgi:hypothetical protein